MNGPPRTATRRSVLAGLAGLTSVSSGCVSRLGAVLSRGSWEQLSVTLQAVPADSDPAAMHIARRLGDHLEAVGINVEVLPVDERQLLQDVLIDQDFDLYVAKHPGGYDPDFLRSFLHSSYAEEPGWQNPLGYANLGVDDLLDKQRVEDGPQRRRILDQVREQVTAESPFVPLVFPYEPTATRNDQYDGWGGDGIDNMVDFLQLDRISDDDGMCRMATTDERSTRNRNPIAVEFRNRGTIMNLMYDSLGRRVNDLLQPWLAESWTWEDSKNADNPTLRVTLRPDLRWHDGEPLTALDVAFTYRFLTDTSLDENEVVIPAPRFRDHTSLVDTVEVVDERTVVVKFDNASREVARQALTVPILPVHEWRELSRQTQIAGIELQEHTPEALVWNNTEPIGSGVLQFEDATPGESLVLSRYDDHFLQRLDEDDHLSAFAGKPAFEQFELVVVPSGAMAVEHVRANEVDATLSGVRVEDVQRIRDADELDLLFNNTGSFYHVGFNCRRPPFGNPRFRAAVAKLLDREHLVHDVFDGLAEEAYSPLAQSTPAVRAPAEDRTSNFPGENGELDTAAARGLFEDAAYRYDEDGNLLISQP